MGQRPSQLGGSRFDKFKLPFFGLIDTHQTTRNPNPEQPIKFQYKTKRKASYTKGRTTESNLNNVNKLSQSHINSTKKTNIKDVKCKIIKTQNNLRPKAEPVSIVPEKAREKHRRKKRIVKNNNRRIEIDKIQQFGYEIEDIDKFLTKATIENPANIPVVLAFPSILYQTSISGYQSEIYLPLGMVVNAIFKNDHWLYVQTPHAEEGYVSYTACIPLGIIPPPDDDESGPCWEKCSDVFPKPCGNMTDTEKLSSKSDCEGERSRCRSRSSRYPASSCGERSVDNLYLKATASSRSKTREKRHTLLVVGEKYEGDEYNGLSVEKGDVVFLLNSNIKNWFWVRNKDGAEGFIPAEIAGHGFL